MPSIYNLNQAAPLWDFIASLEDQGANHPFFAAYNPAAQPSNAPRDVPPEQDGPLGPEGPEHRGPHEHPEGPWGGRRGGRCGGGRRGPPPFARGGGWGGPSRHGGWGGPQPSNMDGIAKFFQQQFGGEEGAEKDSTDFTPPVDVFDTEDAYFIHVSLPGAKKEDVGVNWNADKSELCIAGVVHRPGDEEFLKTLAMGERKVGVFDKKVKLGNRANPASVDADTISAKLEDGVLRVEIPKQDKEYVEVKKVDIE
ncbi:MAG: hypothetical protein M1827_006699 [Pycnora praestabilis]|nr:MAG: hypothetical protein M1827_006699 [Pycnora praestabilis]